MSFVLIHASALATLVADDPLVPAAALPAFDDALALLDGATAVRDAASRAGHAEGLVAGRAEVDAAVAERLLVLTADLDRARAMLRAEAAALAVAIVGRIAATLGPAETVAALAHDAAARLAPDTQARLRVPPVALAATVGRLGGFPTLDIVADASLADDDCVLETSLGQVRAGLAVQLAAVARALEEGGGDAP